MTDPTPLIISRRENEIAVLVARIALLALCILSLFAMAGGAE